MIKVLICGSGELGKKELTLELQKLDIYVIAMDKYENAPAMQVSDEYYVCNMLDANELRKAINIIKPNYIVPEVESIAVNVLTEAKKTILLLYPIQKLLKLQ